MATAKDGPCDVQPEVLASLIRSMPFGMPYRYSGWAADPPAPSPPGASPPGPRISRVEVDQSLRGFFAIDLLDGVLDRNGDPDQCLGARMRRTATNPCGATGHP
jgi:hypothetical protein